MKDEGSNVSIAKRCRWFGFPRSSLPYRPKTKGSKPLDAEAVEQVREVIEEFPTYGVPRITAVLNKRRDTRINHKKVERIVKKTIVGN